MLVQTYGCAISGLSTITVTIELRLIKKGYQHVITGLGDQAIKESIERITGAVQSSSFKMHEGKCSFNLAPSGIKKSGTQYDLPMALALLAATFQLQKKEELESYLIVGELSLSGKVLPVNGTLLMSVHAYNNNFRGIIVPAENAKEAALVTKIPVYPVSSLTEATEFIDGLIKILPVTINTREEFYQSQSKFDCDLSEIRGNSGTIKALTVAASGGHCILLSGSPGVGKSALIKRLVTILPPLTLKESLETTMIYSACGKINEINNKLINQRKIRMPHSGASPASIVGGGGPIISPGECSLAHNGVLFLDELAEFSKICLNSLRGPLEDGFVTIARANQTITFPAKFILAASMNPCECGYLNHSERQCTCSPKSIQKYFNRVSGPLLDRIDVCIDVKAIPAYELTNQPKNESSEIIRKKVIAAREIQMTRFQSNENIYCNAQMTSSLVEQHCKLDKECSELLTSAMQRLKLSGRAYDKILKLSLTISDLDPDTPAGEIQFKHVEEAIGYRVFDRENWIEAAKSTTVSSTPKKKVFKIA